MAANPGGRGAALKALAQKNAEKSRTPGERDPEAAPGAASGATAAPGASAAQTAMAAHGFAPVQRMPSTPGMTPSRMTAPAVTPATMMTTPGGMTPVSRMQATMAATAGPGMPTAPGATTPAPRMAPASGVTPAQTSGPRMQAATGLAAHPRMATAPGATAVPRMATSVTAAPRMTTTQGISVPRMQAALGVTAGPRMASAFAPVAPSGPQAISVAIRPGVASTTAPSPTTASGIRTPATISSSASPTVVPSSVSTQSSPMEGTLSRSTAGLSLSHTPSGESQASTPSPVLVGRGRAMLMAKLGGLQVTKPGAAPGQKTSPVPAQIAKEPEPKTEPSSRPSASPGTVSQGSSSDQQPQPIIMRGKEGRPVAVTANYLDLDLTTGMGLFHYDVGFDPQVDNKQERFRLMAQLKHVTGETKSFDGTALFVPMLLEDQKLENNLKASTGEDVKVKLIYKRQVAFGELESIRMYNILMRRVMNALKMCQMNRNYYAPQGAISVPQHKLEIWPGFVTAIDQYEGGIQLQIDVSHRVLRQETAWDILHGLARRGVADFKTQAEKALLGATILTRYNYKCYKIDDLDFNASPTSIFEDRKGGSITIASYYLSHYQITIKDMAQPLIVSRPKKKAANEGAKEIWLVPELCYLTGLTQEMREDFKVMKDVGQHTRVTPNARQQALFKFIDQIESNEDAKKVLQGWGLKIGKSTVSLTGRVLMPTELQFGRNKSERVGPNADWGRTATSCPVLTPINVDNWVIIFVDKAKNIAQEFSKTFANQAPRMGIQVALPTPKPLANDRIESYLKAIRESVNPKVQLVVTIVPQIRADRYAAIKKLCYIELPIASQVIVAKTISNEKKLASVVQKVALQINCKLGGELWGCRVPIKNLMVVGIDVFHDASRRDNSVYGFVASMNQSFSRWHSTTCDQRPNQELTDSLKGSLITAITKFKHHNNCFPDTIIVFRDGVGDSQLAATGHEVNQLISAFKGIGDDYTPGFSFVVVQKRINTRIYSQAKVAGKADCWDNPAPGTVVDYHITRRHWYDFFLVSQKVNQGTVSPTHYIVVHDSTPSMPPDAMQKLSYTLTHMYFNWPGTVRVPAPCQYAHKLAQMAGEHLHKAPNAVMEDKLFYL